MRIHSEYLYEMSDEVMRRVDLLHKKTFASIACEGLVSARVNF